MWRWWCWPTSLGATCLADERLALLTAVLFGLHPSKVESVAWIGSSCVDGLGAVFFFASLIAFFKWRESRPSRWHGGVRACCLRARCSPKRRWCFVPILIAAYLWLTRPVAGRISRVLRTIAAVRGGVDRLHGDPASGHQTGQAPAPNIFIQLSHSANLWTAPYAIWWYIAHLVLPWGLSVEYAATVRGAARLCRALFSLRQVCSCCWRRLGGCGGGSVRRWLRS